MNCYVANYAKLPEYIFLFFLNFEAISDLLSVHHRKGRVVFEFCSQFPTTVEFQNSLRSLKMKLLPPAPERGLTLRITGK